jgi:hypothetical protein
MPDLSYLIPPLLTFILGLGVWRYVPGWVGQRLRARRYARNRQRVGSASISTSPPMAPTHPATQSQSSVVRIEVAVWDDRGRRIDGVKVTFLTDNGVFATGAMFATLTNSFGARAPQFLAMNPREKEAGIAEAYLDVGQPRGVPGVAHVRAIVERPGAGILLETTITVIGRTAGTGLSLQVSPDQGRCGETLRVEVSASDVNAQPVVDGTVVHLQCDDSARFVGVEPSGSAATTVELRGGRGLALLDTSSSNPGVHSIMAAVQAPDLSGLPRPIAIATATYTCIR